MSADFYIDGNKALQHPANAIIKLCSDTASASLDGLSDGSGWLHLRGTDALFMQGTTDELQQAFGAARNQGLLYVVIPGDDMVCWFVRRKVTAWPEIVMTKTVACVASLSQYWGMTSNNPQELTGAFADWYKLCDYSMAAIDVAEFPNNVLERGRGVNEWSKY